MGVTLGIAMTFNMAVELCVMGGVLGNLLAAAPAEISLPDVGHPLPSPHLPLPTEWSVSPSVPQDTSAMPDTEREDMYQTQDRSLGIAKGVLSTLLGRKG